MRVRTRARELALQFLFQIDFQGDGYATELNAFLDEQLWGKPDTTEAKVYARALVHGVIAHREEIDALYAAGCRYLQMDDTNLAYLCDPVMRAGAVDRGDDPDELPRTYAALINRVIDGRPDDLTVAVHLCRGNFRSTHFASGGYEAVAEVLFNELNVDAYFLEYDDERSGGFAPLRFFPKDKTLVLGLVTSKFAELEDRDDLKARVHEAAAYVDLDQLCLSPQCGFASTAHGNEITEDDQWAKLTLVAEVADDIWS